MAHHTPTSHLERARNQIAAGDMGRLAHVVLKAAEHNRGHWGGGWAEILEILRELPRQERLRLAGALAQRCQEFDEGSAGRRHALTLAAVVSRDLPDELFSVERLKQLDQLARQHSFWYGSRLEVLAEAELAAGRPLAPAAPPTPRRRPRPAASPTSPRRARRATNLAPPISRRRPAGPSPVAPPAPPHRSFRTAGLRACAARPRATA
ncbi:hypothetical protein [Streptomyces sp. NPDC052015]|uniref:hypothetical protein n=1 Tax=Streptomyces sp. NPDC052015 TaxID=3154755 RepID=UPI00343590C3